MKVKELKNLIKEVILKEATSGAYFDHCFEPQLMKKFGISTPDIWWCVDEYTKMANEIGDEGSCVLGNGITINGKIVIRSYAQGSIGLERIQKKIIPYLKEKYPDLKIGYEWGNMD